MNKSKQQEPVCYCFEVYEEEIRAIIRDKKVATVQDLHRHCQAGMGCGTCRSDLEKLVADELQKKRQPQGGK